MKTKITELLGIEYPIVQGAMAWIAEHHLAAAVSKAGGLGIIAGGAAPVDYIREEIHKARAITDKPLGMNIMLLSPNADDLAQLAIDEKIEVLTTGAGNPGKYIADWKNTGIKVMPVVAWFAPAKRMERAGADAVIAEGMEGGGHIGELTTMPLVPQVVDALSIPVIAAGGIADGRQLAAALALSGEADAMSGALALALGIGLQNIPEGAAVSLPLLQNGESRKRAFGAGLASGLVEPLGALLALALAGWVQAALPWLMSAAAGCMVCVTAQEMIPEAVEADEPAGVISVVLGFALMMALDVAL